MLYDPVITVMALFLIFYQDKTWLSNTIVAALFGVYIGLRFFMKYRAYRAIKITFKEKQSCEITVLPSLMAFYKWDYIVSTEEFNYVGQYNSIKNTVSIRTKFERIEEDLKAYFEGTKLGKYFAEFTPNYHIKKDSVDGKTILTAIDLRYYLKNNFMHHGTLTLDENLKIEESVFQPYKLHRRIPVAEDVA